jgi:hypothetical protein
MTCAAAAAHGADQLLDVRTGTRLGLAWMLVLSAGLVEGLALGVAQSTLLRRILPRLRAGRYVVVTLAVAGIGWAAGSVPSLSSTGEADQQPSWFLLGLAGAGMGLVLGTLLGTAQGLVLRPVAPHWLVWPAAGCVGWTGAMTLLMLGASAPSASWGLAAVLAWAALTGAAAGAVLGAVLGWSAGSLTGPPVGNRILLGLLQHGRPRRLRRRFLGLEVRGRRTGRRFRLPVMYAPDGTDGDVMWVAVGNAAGKRWWRNVKVEAPVAVLHDGGWHAGRAVALSHEDLGFDAGREAYTRCPGTRYAVGGDDVIVKVTLDRTDAVGRPSASAAVAGEG